MSIIKVLTHKTNIIQILSVIIVPYNLCHKFISPLKHKLTENNNKFENKKIIKLLKSKDSHGYDEIPTQLLKISSPFISSPLNHICNKVLTRGTFTYRLKLSIIKPLY